MFGWDQYVGDITVCGAAHPECRCTTPVQLLCSTTITVWYVCMYCKWSLIVLNNPYINGPLTASKMRFNFEDSA